MMTSFLNPPFPPPPTHQHLTLSLPSPSPVHAMPPYKRRMVPASAGRAVRRRTTGYRSAGSSVARQLSRAADYRRGPGPTTGLSVGAPIPDRMVTKLSYYQVITLTGGAGIQDQVFSLNCLYDPDISGGGHQPRGFDQWASFYARYRVVAVSARVTGNANQDSTWNMPYNYGLIPSVSTSRFVTSDIPFEMPRSKYQATTNMAAPVDIRGTYYPWQIIGVTKERYMSDDIYASLTSACPAAPVGLHVYAEPLQATTATVSLSVKLTYTVVFDQRVTIGSS